MKYRKMTKMLDINTGNFHREFMKLPLEERRKIMAEQAKTTNEYYAELNKDLWATHVGGTPPFNEDVDSGEGVAGIEVEESEHTEATSDVLPYSISQVLDSVEKLFSHKNGQYQSDSHWASAILEADVVSDGEESPLIYALNLMSKQDKAGRQLIFAAFKNAISFNKKGGIPMLKERLMDGVVYRVIMLALLQEHNDLLLDDSLLYSHDDGV